MLGVTIKHNSSLHLVIPVLPSSTFHTLEFKVLPTGIFVRLDVLHANMAGIRPNLR